MHVSRWICSKMDERLVSFWLDEVPPLTIQDSKGPEVQLVVGKDLTSRMIMYYIQQR